MLNLHSANVIQHREYEYENQPRSSAMFAIVNRICTGRGGISSCQVDSNNSKPAATDTRMFPRWDWFDEMAMPPFIWLRGLKSPERITEVHISYLLWLCHEKEMHLLTYTQTHKPCQNQHIYLPRSTHANVRKYRVVLCSAWWVVHWLASTPQCIIFLQSTNTTLISHFDWIISCCFFCYKAHGCCTAGLVNNSKNTAGDCCPLITAWN